VPKFIQIETASVRVTDPKNGHQHDVLEVFALGHPMITRRVFVGTLAGTLLAAPLAAETFSGSCQAIFV
jgi:hypothetical protein